MTRHDQAEMVSIGQMSQRDFFRKEKSLRRSLVSTFPKNADSAAKKVTTIHPHECKYIGILLIYYSSWRTECNAIARNTFCCEFLVIVKKIPRLVRFTSASPGSSQYSYQG